MNEHKGAGAREAWGSGVLPSFPLPFRSQSRNAENTATQPPKSKLHKISQNARETTKPHKNQPHFPATHQIQQKTTILHRIASKGPPQPLTGQIHTPDSGELRGTPGNSGGLRGTPGKLGFSSFGSPNGTANARAGRAPEAENPAWNLPARIPS